MCRLDYLVAYGSTINHKAGYLVCFIKANARKKVWVDNGYKRYYQDENY